MKSRKLTLRKEMLLGLSLLLLLAGAFEFVGHLQMQTLGRKATYARQVNRVERLFDAVDRTNKLDPATGKVSSEWTKAKDSFLAGVNGLAQTQSIDKKDIQDIQKAWQAYETSSPRTATAQNAVRSVVDITLNKAGKTAEASLHQAMAATDFGLRVAVLIGSLMGVGIVLLIAKDIRSRLGEVRHQLGTVTHSQTVQTQVTVSKQDDLKLQAEQLTKAVAELNDFIGQSVAQNVTVEKEQLQEEKICNN
jgi:hypothetical protein